MLNRDEWLYLILTTALCAALMVGMTYALARLDYNAAIMICSMLGLM